MRHSVNMYTVSLQIKYHAINKHINILYIVKIYKLRLSQFFSDKRHDCMNFVCCISVENSDSDARQNFRTLTLTLLSKGF